MVVCLALGTNRNSEYGNSTNPDDTRDKQVSHVDLSTNNEWQCSLEVTGLMPEASFRIEQHG